MKKFILLSSICIFSLQLGFSQQNKIIQWEKVYTFIDDVDGNDTVKYNLSSHLGFGVFTDDLSSALNDSIFSPEDVTYMNKQLVESQKMNWKNGKIKGAYIISKNKIKRIFTKRKGWDKFRKKYGKSCLTSFSIPLFNVAHSYCIFYNWTQCDYLSGRGDLSLYQVKNGKWVFVESYSMGIS